MDRTADYLNRDGARVADLFAQEADHLYHQWAHVDCTPDDLKELSTIAAALGSRFHKIAGDALDLAEKLDPTPIGFDVAREQCVCGEPSAPHTMADHRAVRDAMRAALRLVKDEETAAEVRNGEHVEEAL